MCGVVESMNRSSFSSSSLRYRWPFIFSPWLRNSKPNLPFQLKQPQAMTFRGYLTGFCVSLGLNLSDHTGLLH